jgi:hypothetical protein
MPRHWTAQQRQTHAAFMKRLHRERGLPHFRLPDHKRAAVAAALHQSAVPNASRIADRLGVSHFYVCAVARAEGIALRPGRRSGSSR